VYFDSGCFADQEATLFKNAEPGKYYDFSSAVSMEVRSNQDPYMVFANVRDNLGTDFSIFFYMSILTFSIGGVAILIILYLYCFAL
jgi:hypothetical protein